METTGPSNENPDQVLCQMKALLNMLKKKIVQVASKAKKVGDDNPRRIIHSLKVGLALTLVSLFYYFRPVYDSFGDSAIWAVLTVVVVFEFTIGATLGKSINRGLTSLLAGALGVGAQHFASLAGDNEGPIVLSFLVFILAAGATFSRFFQRIKARYDYGVVIFILTFNLVAVSGYRVEEILELAHQSLLTVLIGGLICIIISMAICPVWAGEDFHKLVALNIEKLADFLEGFGDEYFNDKGDNESGTSMREKSFLTGYKTVLSSKTSEEVLANFAGWEPSHGHFGFGHPWKQYLKVGVLTRKCAYQVEALNIYINTEVPEEFKKAIEDACTKMSSETGKALRKLASGIRKKKQETASNIHVISAKIAADNLNNNLTKTSLPQNTDLFSIIPATTVASLLVKIVSSTEELVDSVHDLGCLANFKSYDATVSPEMLQLHLHQQGTVNPLVDDDGPHVVITVCEQSPVPGENKSRQRQAIHHGPKVQA